VVAKWLAFIQLEGEVQRKPEEEDEEIPSAPAHHRMLELAQGGW